MKDNVIEFIKNKISNRTADNYKYISNEKNKF